MKVARAHHRVIASIAKQPRGLTRTSAA
ncbi:MAG: hypothetical protein RLZZ141_228, partial [Pseudomonadota bacterium]